MQNSQANGLTFMVEYLPLKGMETVGNQNIWKSLHISTALSAGKGVPDEM